MGEIADMMLEGLLDEETGEYIGDINEGVYGLQSPGFPISYERNGFDSDAPGVIPSNPNPATTESEATDMAIRIDHDRKTATRETDNGPLAMAYDEALAALRLGRAYEAGAEE